MCCCCFWCAIRASRLNLHSTAFSGTTFCFRACRRRRGLHTPKSKNRDICFLVQVKKYEIYDGITFQWFMCAGILMVGFVSSTIFGDFGMKDRLQKVSRDRFIRVFRVLDRIMSAS